MQVNIERLQHQVVYDLISTLDEDLASRLRQSVELEEYSVKLSKHAEFVTACIDGTIVGVIAFYTNEQDSELYVPYVCIGSMHRRKGIAARLMLQLIEHAQNKGYSISLEVLVSNTSAISLYRKFGFEIYEQASLKYKLRRGRHLVGIRCSTYNQESYITDTMNGFASQQTDFPFIAMIVDDASTDTQPQVISEYVDQNFDEIEHFVTHASYITYARHRTNRNCYFLILYLKENHYQKGIHYKKLDYLVPWRKDIRYEALCEGDDWWTDPLKLQKQVEYLEKHTDCSLCCTGYASFRLKDGLVRKGDGKEKDITLRNLMRRNSIGTLTVMYRRSLYDDYQRDVLPFMPKFRMGDLPLWIYLAWRGRIHKLPDETAVYRVLKLSASHNDDFDRQYDFVLETTRIRLWLNKHLRLRYSLYLKLRMRAGSRAFCRKWARRHNEDKKTLWKKAKLEMKKV